MNRHGFWVPRDLKEKQFNRPRFHLRLSTQMQFSAQRIFEKKKQKKTIRRDEKLTVYNNVVRKSPDKMK